MPFTYCLTTLCPCGSDKLLSDCCLPYIKGTTPAPTPLSLMCSRYTAYVMHNADYLLATWQPEYRPQSRQPLIDSFAHTDWQGLTIISEQPGKQSDEGFVEFVARFTEQGQPLTQMLHERSRFVRYDQQWFYCDGVQPKVSRNSPCPCGSGKKNKACCGR